MAIKEVDARQRLRKAVGAYPTQQAAAKDWGISPSYLSDMLAGKRGITDQMLARLNLRATVVETAKAGKR